MKVQDWKVDFTKVIYFLIMELKAICNPSQPLRFPSFYGIFEANQLLTNYENPLCINAHLYRMCFSNNLQR